MYLFYIIIFFISYFSYNFSMLIYIPILEWEQLQHEPVPPGD